MAEIKIQLSAEDNASPAIKRVSDITDQQVRIMNTATGSSDALSKQWGKLKSVTELLASGIKKFRNIIEGILWGTLIGAVAVVIQKLIEWIFQAWKAKESADALSISIVQQSEKWGLILKPLQDATKSTVALYNAELALAQFRQQDQGRVLQERMKSLKTEIVSLQESLGRLNKEEITEFEQQISHGLQEKLLGLTRDLGKTVIEFETWEKVMALTPQTIESVSTSLKTLSARQKEQLSVQETIGKQILELSQSQYKQQGQIQEQLGKDILAAAQAEYRDKVSVQTQIANDVIGEAQREWRDKGAIQEQLGRDIVAAARWELEEKGKIQEEIGRLIVALAQIEYQEKGKVQEMIGKQIVEIAQKEMADKAAIQEMIGKQIVDAAQKEYTDRAAIQEMIGRQIVDAAIKEMNDRAAAQETIGRQIVDLELQNQRDRAAAQETIGRQIVDAATKEYNDKRKLQEAMGKNIRDQAKLERDIANQTKQHKIQAGVDTFNAAEDIAGALYTMTGEKSKTLFTIWKATAIASAIMDTYAAATKALASAPPPWNYVAAAAVIAAGLANVARIQSTEFGSTSAGGGSSASTSSSTGSDTSFGFSDTSSSDEGDELVPLNVTINIQGNMVGNEEYVNDYLIPAIEEAVRNERSDIALRR